jgi:hypothetical protein
MAGTTGLEPATSAVTGQHSNQLNYVPTCSSATTLEPMLNSPRILSLARPSQRTITGFASDGAYSCPNRTLHCQ